jgi:hypothetical protein
MKFPTDPAEKLQFLLEIGRTLYKTADEEALERHIHMTDLDMATGFAEEYAMSYGLLDVDECDKLIEFLTPLAGHIRNLSWKTLYQEPIEDYDLKFLIEPFSQVRYGR